MKRLAFLAGSSALALSPLMTQPADAILLPVFDAASYSKLISQLTESGKITANTALQAQRALQTLQQLSQMNSLNIGSLYSLATPHLKDIVNAAKVNVQIPVTADKLLVQFAQAFPNWNPGGNYALLYQSALTGARKAIASSVQEAQAVDNQNGKQVQVIDDLVTMPPASIKDAMTIGNFLAANTVASINTLSSTMGHQFEDQGSFMQAMYQSQEALRRSPGMSTLISTFSLLPTQLQNVGH